MPIPDFQALMAPILRVLEGQHEIQHGDLRDSLGAELRLTPTELAETLPSGRQLAFDNRVRWATFHLRKAGLIECPRRGILAITNRGREILGRAPERVDMKLLLAFPEYREFRRRQSKPGDGPTAPQEPEVTATPEVQIATAFENLQQSLAQEILDTLKQGSSRFFEKVVVDLLLAMGYGGAATDAGRVVGRSGDGGIDGVIKEDKLGLDLVYVQAKKWVNTVGRPEVQAFAGSLDGVKSKRGVMITTSTFTADARRFVDQIEKKIVLIDGEGLAELMIEHGVGVVERQRYVIRKLDIDYFTDG